MLRPFSAYSGEDPYIFVCYSHADKAVVYPELSWLREAGHNIWYDEGILPGHEWNEDLASAIRNAGTFVMFLTPDAERSRYCRRELGFALDLDKRIVAVHLLPTQLSDGMRLSLGDIQAVLKYEYSDAHYRGKLLNVLAGEAPDASAVEAPHSAPPRSNPSIAVLPFVEMGKDDNDRVFGDGLAEEILNLLGRIEELQIASSTSCYYFRDRQSDIQSIAQQLNVRYVMEGTVRWAGERLRVAVRLIDSASGFQVISEKYDCTLTDIFDVQDQIAGQVVAALRIALSPASSRKLTERPTSNSRALELYLRGRAYLRRSDDSDVLAKAERCFTQAIDLDPDYAQAYAGLTQTYLKQYQVKHAQALFERAIQASERCLQLDPDSVDVRVALGDLYLKTGRLEESEAELRAALQVDPQNIEARERLSQTLSQAGRGDEALQIITRLIEEQPEFWRGHHLLANHHFNKGEFAACIAPLQRVLRMDSENSTAALNLGSAHYMLDQFQEATEAWELSMQIAPNLGACSNLGTLYFFNGEFASAAEKYRQCTEMVPDDHRGWGNLGDACTFLAGAQAEAEAAYRRALQLIERELTNNPQDMDALIVLGHCQARLGNTDDALAAIERLMQTYPELPDARYYAAVTLCSLGLDDGAVEHLSEAVRVGYPKAILQSDPQLARLRDRADVQALLAD